MPKAQHPTISLIAACITLTTLPVLFALLAKQWASTVKWSRTAAFLTLSDGRRLAYATRGRESNKHVGLYIHGSPSCRSEWLRLASYFTVSRVWQIRCFVSRLEFLGLSEDLLDKLNLRLVAFDRPGYGQSDIHYGRSYRSFVTDLEQLADHLGIAKFFLIGVSGLLREPSQKLLLHCLREIIADRRRWPLQLGNSYLRTSPCQRHSHIQWCWQSWYGYTPKAFGTAPRLL